MIRFSSILSGARWQLCDWLHRLAHQPWPAESKLSYLQRLLRSTPQWRYGHILVCELALVRSELELANASLYAARTLGASDRELAALDGRYFLLGGQPQKAIERFALVVPTAAAWLSSQEDLAAAYVQLERFSEARVALEKIPEDRRSPSARVALEYVTRKLFAA